MFVGLRVPEATMKDYVALQCFSNGTELPDEELISDKKFEDLIWSDTSNLKWRYVPHFRAFVCTYMFYIFVSRSCFVFANLQVWQNKLLH